MFEGSRREREREREVDPDIKRGKSLIWFYRTFHSIKFAHWDGTQTPCHRHAKLEQYKWTLVPCLNALPLNDDLTVPCVESNCSLGEEHSGNWAVNSVLFCCWLIIPRPKCLNIWVNAAFAAKRIKNTQSNARQPNLQRVLRPAFGFSLAFGFVRNLYRVPEFYLQDFLCAETGGRGRMGIVPEMVEIKCASLPKVAIIGTTSKWLRVNGVAGITSHANKLDSRKWRTSYLDAINGNANSPRKLIR